MDMINFALIGCGNIAYRHIEAIQTAENARLIAVCDIDSDRASEKALFAQVPFYLSYDDMLQKHPEVDVVTILTPSGKHFEQAVDILTTYQKHLLIEKPFVLTIAQAQQLKKIANVNHLHIFPVFQNRFNKAVQRIKQSLVPTQEANELGALRVATLSVRWCRTQKYYDLSTWRGTWAMDGGALTNQGIHFIDLLRYLCGEVKQVHAKLTTFGAKIEVEDTAVAILEFNNGALGIIEIMTSARPNDYEASLSCVCENGMAIIGGVATNHLKLFTPDPTQTAIHSETFNTSYGFGHNIIMQNIVDVLLQKKPPLIRFEDGLETIKLLHALYKSDEKNGWVDVEEAGDSSRLGASIATTHVYFDRPAVLNINE